MGCRSNCKRLIRFCLATWNFDALANANANVIEALRLRLRIQYAHDMGSWLL